MYINSKLYEIIQILTIHEGNSSQRLAMAGHLIILLNVEEIPEQYRLKFNELQKRIRDNLKPYLGAAVRPTKIHKMHKTTASKHIAFLWELNDYLNSPLR